MIHVKEKANADIRMRLKGKKIPYWQLCKKLDISEQTLVRWLREPLPQEVEQRIKDLLKVWN